MRGADAGMMLGGGDVAPGQPLVPKAVPHVAVEVGALRFGGDQFLEDGVGDREVAIDRAAAEFQIEGRLDRVPHRREER